MATDYEFPFTRLIFNCMLCDIGKHNRESGSLQARQWGPLQGGRSVVFTLTFRPDL